MRRSPLSVAVGRRWCAAAGVALAASIAACGDAATSPQSPAVARGIERPSEFVGQIAATVTIRIVDTTGATLKETGWINFSTGPTDSLSVYDNTARDLDPAVGVIKVLLKKSGNYKACFSRSAHYYRDYGAGLQKWPQLSFAHHQRHEPRPG